MFANGIHVTLGCVNKLDGFFRSKFFVNIVHPGTGAANKLKVGGKVHYLPIHQKFRADNQASITSQYFKRSISGYSRLVIARVPQSLGALNKNGVYIVYNKNVLFQWCIFLMQIY